MSEAGFASLGPTLLARKGGAKPAMRPQLAPLPELLAANSVNDEQLEDLGWNDMGQDEDAGSNDNIVSIIPNAAPQGDTGILAESPVVHRQQRKLAQRILAEKTVAPEALIGKASAQARRAAFTLRLDTDRHLKLRLAATMQGTSAQALVTQALDALLAEIDDLDAIASRMKRN